MAVRRLWADLCSVSLFVFLYSICTEAAVEENIYASGCSGFEVTLECAPAHRIAIKRLFYGVKRSWDCQQIPRKADCCEADHKDCVVNDDTKYPTLNTHCSGYERCTFLVQKIPVGSRCGTSAYTDYMTVIYDCVPDEDIAMFCQDDVKKGRTLYLANREYPKTVQEEKADCMCMVRTTANTQGINIHSIDVLLAWTPQRPRSCSKELAIKDERGYRWDIQCGEMAYHGFRTIYTQPVHNVTLTLSSSSNKGSAFVWLQTRATDDKDELEIYCGEPLRQILLRARQEAESRHRNRGGNSGGTTPHSDTGQDKNITYPHTGYTVTVSSNFAAIVGGIVAAGIVLISAVIIAITIHCRREQQNKHDTKQQSLNLYPAVTNSETTNLTSYCRYNDYDDEHYTSINRSPFKMASLTDTDIATSHARSNGFVTLGRAETSLSNGHVQEDVTIRDQSPSLPRSPVSPRSPSSTHSFSSSFAPKSSPSPSHSPSPPAIPGSPSPPTESLLIDPSFNGHLSLRYPRTNGQLHSVDIHDGHKTLPDNRKILVSGPKSPLGKRSKSVTFSQPVAMVTPLPSGSEESVGEDIEMEGEFGKGSPTCSLEDGNYDNLNKVIIPDHPLSPSQLHTLPIHHAEAGYHVNGVHGNSNSLPRSLTTFRCQGEEGEEGGGSPVIDYDDVPFSLPPPPPPISSADTYAVVHKKPVPLPVFHPQKQNAQLYETGV